MQTQWQVTRHAKIGSTMEEAKRLARAGAPHGTVVVAEEQTDGRGQHGHVWASPPGGLYLSIVLRDIQDPRLITMAIGVAVAEALEVAGVEPKLKWVNDVWVKGKKIAGVLVEGESTGNKTDFLVAGVGINVNGDGSALPKEFRSQATTLEKELACESCIPDLETLLLHNVETWVNCIKNGERGEVLDAFRRKDALIGHTVIVENEGVAPIKGKAGGIDDDGRLLVKTADGVEAVMAGMVRLA